MMYSYGVTSLFYKKVMATEHEGSYLLSIATEQLLYKVNLINTLVCVCVWLHERQLHTPNTPL